MESMVAEATQQRSTEHTQALISIKEYQDAQGLIQNAITVLQEFYNKKQQQDASLVQVGQEPEEELGSPPPTWDEGYKGAVDTAGGVIGILEVALSDFAKLESETTTQEEVSQKEYDNLMSENGIRKAVSGKNLENKGNTKVKLESTIQRLKQDLSGYEKELEAVNVYIEKLTPSCTTQGDTAEERKARREEEIKSLQEALAI